LVGGTAKIGRPSEVTRFDFWSSWVNKASWFGWFASGEIAVADFLDSLTPKFALKKNTLFKFSASQIQFELLLLYVCLCVFFLVRHEIWFLQIDVKTELLS
jgi:hypothetical protein